MNVCEDWWPESTHQACVATAQGHPGGGAERLLSVLAQDAFFGNAHQLVSHDE
jgi:hypothetical protein